MSLNFISKTHHTMHMKQEFEFVLILTLRKTVSQVCPKKYQEIAKEVNWSQSLSLLAKQFCTLFFLWTFVSIWIPTKLIFFCPAFGDEDFLDFSLVGMNPKIRLPMYLVKPRTKSNIVQNVVQKINFFKDESLLFKMDEQIIIIICFEFLDKDLETVFL